MKDIFMRFNNLSRAVKASIAFIICNVLTKGISLITLPVFSRLLSTEEYGRFITFSSWETIISIFASLNVWGGVFNAGLSKCEDINCRKRYISAVQGMGLTISMLYLIIGLVFSQYISKLLKLNRFLTICIFIQVFFDIAYNLWVAGERFEYNYIELIIVTIFQTLSIPVLGYYLVINTDSFKVEGRILGILVIHMLVGSIYLIRNFTVGKCFFDIKIWKYVFMGNTLLIPHYLSIQVLNQSDRLMISGICGESDAGIYGTAYTFAMLLTLVSTGIESSYTPYLFKSLKTQRINDIRKVSSATVTLVAIMCLGLICIIPDVFFILLPPSYHSSLSCIPPVAIGAFFMFLFPIFGSMEFYFDKTKYVTIISCIFGVINIILNWIFIRIFGYIAAAYTTFICYMGMSLVHALIVRQIIKKKDLIGIVSFRELFAISFIFSILALILTATYNNSIIRYLFIFIIIVLVYVYRKKIIEILNQMKEGGKSNGK